jgi:hypothetical protein
MIGIAAVLLLGGLSGCAQKETGAAPMAAATLHEIMVSLVTPASNGVWTIPDSIADPDSAEGKAQAANIDADWTKVQQAAVLMAEIPNLLAMEGRLVVTPGAKLDGEGQGGNLTGAQIQEKLKTDRAAYLERLRVLQTASLDVLAAANKRDYEGVLNAGGKIEEACEACHKQFWYPEPAPK